MFGWKCSFSLQGVTMTWWIDGRHGRTLHIQTALTYQQKLLHFFQTYLGLQSSQFRSTFLKLKSSDLFGNKKCSIFSTLLFNLKFILHKLVQFMPGIQWLTYQQQSLHSDLHSGPFFMTTLSHFFSDSLQFKSTALKHHVSSKVTIYLEN